MAPLLAFTRVVDRVIGFFGHVGAWCGILLAFVVCYDVVTRYFGVPKPFGFNSTQFQESEYWLHSFMFALVLGYAYLKQAHVRIDLLREKLPPRGKYTVEILGCLLFLIPYTTIVGDLCIQYVARSYASGEASKSTIGLTHIWIVKSAMLWMYGLLALAGISQLIKSVAGFLGQLPDEMVAETLGGEL